jgi:septum formation protein
MQPSPPPLVLASASPRRRELLRRLGLPFGLAVPAVDETPLPGEPPEQLAARLAFAKATATLAQHPTALVMAADTVVSLEGRSLGKPANSREATAMLRALWAREHTVVTAVCVRRVGAKPWTGACRTRVWMRPYSDAEVAAYVATGDPLDKAGGYAIQHPTFQPVERLDGSYTDVVGLPLPLVCTLLRAAGLSPRCSPDEAVASA